MTKRLIEMALAEGRRLLSKQTGFIHYFPHLLPDETAQAIPLLENLHYALALFRSHTSENVLEGKAMLQRLLNFQGENGNFPVYLHDWPHSHDRSIGASWLAPLHLIIEEYHSILGADLNSALKKTLQKLMQYCEEHKAQFPYLQALKFACIKAHRGDPKEWLTLCTMRTEWFTPSALGEILCCFQMVNRDLSTFPELWDFLGKIWHTPTMSYCGPAHGEFLIGNSPQVTTLHLYMAELKGHFSQAVQKPTIAHLSGSLICPAPVSLPPPAYPQESVYPGWKGLQTEIYGYSLTCYQETIDRKANKGFHPFRLFWGNAEQLHSLVCQGGNGQTFDWGLNEEEVFLDFSLGDLPEDEEREKMREVLFFVDLHEGCRILVDEEASTTFQLDNELTIQSGEKTIKLRFVLLEGEATFFGHISKGSRPAQLLVKGPHRYDAYDWQIFLRTVRRSPHCRLRCIITL